MNPRQPSPVKGDKQWSDHGQDLALLVFESLCDVFPAAEVNGLDSINPWINFDNKFNLHIRRKWRGHRKSCYLILYAGHGQSDYILEMDTSLIVRDNDKFTWSLNKPTNEDTRSAIEGALGPAKRRSDGYKTAVSRQKLERSQPDTVGSNGYALAEDEPLFVVMERLVDVIVAVSSSHGGVIRPLKRTSEGPTLVAEQVNASFEARVQESLRASGSERKRRLELADPVARKASATTTVFIRNPDVVAETLLRADGICELCRCPAPFFRRTDGTPYLEVHHVIQLSNGGEDTVENAVAACPNCHRKAHFG